jgi:hypothetical protein
MLQRNDLWGIDHSCPLQQREGNDKHPHWPESTTNFQQTQERREFADNLHSSHCIKRMIVYAVNSIIIKCWWWIKAGIIAEPIEGMT